MSIQKTEYDDTDKLIARILSEDAILSSGEIGAKVGLSSSAANERVRKLKAGQKIKKIGALLDGAFIEMGLTAFVFVCVDGKENNRVFLDNILQQKNILECHHITGEYSYVLKVCVADAAQLEQLITDFLKEQPGVRKTVTQVVLSSAKGGGVFMG